MMTETGDTPNWRRPSPKYLFHLAMAIVGMSSLGVALGAEMRYRAGLGTAAVMNHEGLWAFILSMSWGYTFRLIFWGRVPPRYQNLVRNLLSAFMAVELPLAAIAVFLFTTLNSVPPSNHAADRILITVFTVFGTLCQISTVIWLLRYRKE